MMVQEYRMVAGISPSDISNRVNELLSSGWKLYGLPMVVPAGTGNYFSQAVIREIEQPGAWG